MSRFAICALVLLILAIGAVQVKAARATASRPAATIQVFPGANAIRKALKNANPGDTLNIHAGTYNEAVRVRKDNLTLESAGDGEVIVDNECNSDTTINLEAEGITIKGLTVRGAGEYDINIIGIDRAVIRQNMVESTCPAAEYGVNVNSSGATTV